MSLIRTKQLIMDADLAMNSNKVTGVTAGTASTDAVNKGQLDAVAAGLSWKDAVVAASTVDDLGSSGAVTYANGTLGVGATLTSVALEALPAQDGVTLVLGDRLLVKDQALGEENGIYELTILGVAATTAWELTRVTDADVSAELDSATVMVQGGTVAADKGYTQTANAPTIGTTALTWVEFTAGATLGYKTVAGDTGSAIADVSADTLTLTGGDGIVTAAADNPEVVTFTADVAEGIAISAAKITSSGWATKYAASGVTAGNDASTGVTLGAIPAAATDVYLKVNGIGYEVGDAVSTKDAYIATAAAPTVPIAFSAAVAADLVIWNGTTVGYDLDASDELEISFLVA